MKLDVNNIPEDIQEMLDRDVDFRELEDALDDYNRLKQVENFASSKGIPHLVECDWSYLYELHDSSAEEFSTLLKLDEKYGINNLIELQDEYEG